MWNSRLVERAIERVDELELNPDLEPDDFAEDDDPAEDEHDTEIETRSTIAANWHLDGPCRELTSQGGR